jgi:hypothetical protein
MYYYQVLEDGSVVKTSKASYEESRAKPFLRDGMATVKINNKDYRLKNLVAKHFIPGWLKGDYVEVIDGNPFNCRVGNLRIYKRAEHGKRTGHKSRGQKVLADGIEHRSVRECAKALYVSYQTLFDYMNGKVKNSVLSGKNIYRAGECAQ